MDIIGPRVQSKLRSSRQSYNTIIRLNIEPLKCKKYDYVVINDTSMINELADYDKFLWTADGCIYGTITGLFTLQFYHLVTNDRDLGRYHNQIQLRDSDLLRGDIRWIMLLRKLRKLPRFVCYLILLESRKLHLTAYQRYDHKFKYICSTCPWLLYHDQCAKCNRCDLCDTIHKTILECDECGRMVCKHCMGYAWCQSMVCICHECFNYECPNGHELPHYDETSAVIRYCADTCTECGEYI